MADVKTNLRELSVGFHFYRDENRPLTPNEFLDKCSENIIGCMGLGIHNIASRLDSFTDEETQVIRNGLKLGKVIKEVFEIASHPQIWWVGSSTQSGETVDLIINDLRFSLKEESYILENMGLYKIMNLIMDKQKYSRGLHVFEEFALNELYEWFDVTKRLLIKYGPIPCLITGHNYHSTVNMDKNHTLELTYKEFGEEISSVIPDFPNCDYSCFQRLTNSTTREKVFSKWLKERVENDTAYIYSKRKCALTAGNNIENLLAPYVNTSPSTLLRLYRAEGYYYAKTTLNSAEIYQVPSISDSNVPLKINDIRAKVPHHQLNIHTLIENMDTRKIIEFRNELRYSHGQFNGPPEAKFYIASGDMTALYKKIYPS